MELEQIINARKSLKVSNCEKSDVIKVLIANVGYVSMVKGQEMQPTMQSFIAKEVYDEIFSKKIDFAIDEISVVFRNGVYGRYGEYFGINAFTIVGWFESYLSSDERFNAKNKEKTESYVMICHDESEDAIQKRNDEAMKSSAMRYYQESQSKGGVFYSLDVLKAGVYDYLVRIGKIKNSEERIASAMTEVKESIRKKQRKMSRGVNQINSVIDVAANLGDKSLVTKAKAMVLEKFYKALYDTGRELKL